MLLTNLRLPLQYGN